MTPSRSQSLLTWLQAGPMMLVFVAFFILPLCFVVMVSFWDYNEYEMIPAFTTRGYYESFEGCLTKLPEMCTMLATYVNN